ncbi:transposase [Bradyrhizobium japonicum]|uniref:Transposase n=1 Tax=Bradyrhizobium diazoefficiens TaxID=1355477 RepID=A0A809XZL1_9BRAD|nr:transposase [Bradyrhizobium japonicum]BBZ97140.1 hypothetical protein F07S3_69730 [Bradyrhizobium diazoefficiens]BCA06197.1 hypothetical protein H12S4_71010 [Bradyrhizobium diazoefficiens]BCA14826.1 hypothetical protein BDHF08_66730 [Bradyrhizobium diazoefficiens]BCA23549.1 hypothetical protein BDHH15_67640 [Bradyrhizobium diazoefficiens]
MVRTVAVKSRACGAPHLERLEIVIEPNVPPGCRGSGPSPAHLVESGLPTEALLAQIAVAKYADGPPLYRREAIYA